MFIVYKFFIEHGNPSDMFKTTDSFHFGKSMGFNPFHVTLNYYPNSINPHYVTLYASFVHDKGHAHC